MSEPIQIVFKRNFLSGFMLVFSALLISTWIDQLLNKQIEDVIRAATGLSNMIWFWGALSLATSLFFPLLLSLLCCHALTNPQASVTDFLKNKFELGLIETLRAWGKTFAWCFVFIIPGLVKYTYYLLAPFVVMFSRKYGIGEVDALEHSKTISLRFWWRLNIWLTVFYMLLPLATSSLLDERRLFSTNPFSAIFCVVFETVLVFSFHFFILKLFIKYMNEVEGKPAPRPPASALKESYVSDV